MIDLTIEPIDTQRILASAAADDCGATVLFLGTTRRKTDLRVTQSLAYTAYESMAAAQMTRLETLARDRWPIHQCVLVHRLGDVPVGEASVAIAVSSPHRRDAFEAASWLIDALKKLVPVWKKEIWEDGSSAWVHPGASPPSKADRTLES